MPCVDKLHHALPEHFRVLDFRQLLNAGESAHKANTNGHGKGIVRAEEAHRSLSTLALAGLSLMMAAT